MRNWLTIPLLVALAALLPFHATAQDEIQDTVYFYTSWEHMLELTPEAVVVNPMIDPITPFEVYIETEDDRYNTRISEDFIAATLGDSIWLINSDCLKRQFKGDAKKLNGFIPVFFNEKVAYLVYAGMGNRKVSLLDVLFGVDEYDTTMEFNVDYYYIDFLNRKVIKITPSTLSELLAEYHDLQMRYEGMKNYKDSEIIEDYFFKYIDRASQDFMRPYIVDLVDSPID